MGCTDFLRAFSGALRSDSRRFLSIRKLLAGMLVVSFICCISMSDVITMRSVFWEEMYKRSVCDQMHAALVFDRFKSLLVLAVSAFVAPSFAKDQNTHFVRNHVLRCGLLSYACARLVTVFLYIISVVVSGFLLTAAVLSPLMIVHSKNPENYGAFASLVHGKGVWVYLVLLAFNFSLSVIPTCNIGLWISVWKPNRYAAIGSTFFAFYLLYALTGRMPELLSYSDMSSAPSPYGGYLIVWQLAYFLAAIVFTGWAYYHSLRRRYRNGLL